MKFFQSKRVRVFDLDPTVMRPTGDTAPEADRRYRWFKEKQKRQSKYLAGARQEAVRKKKTIH